MQVPARSLRQNLIHPPFVKRVYSECSPLIQLIALINNLKGTDHVGTFMGLKCVVYYANYRSGINLPRSK